MPTCPKCGHVFSGKLPASEIELSLKVLQKKLGSRVINLKREIAHHFGVKKFADVPPEKYPEALELAEEKTEYFTAVWGANKVLEIAVPEYLRSVPGAVDGLRRNLERSLRRNFGDRYWAEMEPEQAVEAIKEAVGDKNLWEYAHKSTGTLG